MSEAPLDSMPEYNEALDAFRRQFGRSKWQGVTPWGYFIAGYMEAMGRCRNDGGTCAAAIFATLDDGREPEAQR